MSEVIDNLISSLVNEPNDVILLAELKKLFNDTGMLPSLSTVTNAPGNAVSYIGSTIGYFGSSVASMLPSASNLPVIGNRFQGAAAAKTSPATKLEYSPPSTTSTIDKHLLIGLQIASYKDVEDKLETGMREPPLAVLLMRFGCIESFKYCLQQNAIPLDMLVEEFQDKQKVKWEALNLLHYAVLQGAANFAEVLMNTAKTQKKDLFPYNGRVKCGVYSPLISPAHVAHMAAMRGTYNDLFEKLKKYGCDFDVADGRGNTPLHMATLAGNKIALKCLFLPSLKIQTKEKKTNKPLANNAGDDPLRIALLKNDPELVQVFIDNKMVSADVHPMDESNHYQLALACDQLLIENTREKSKKCAPLFLPELQNAKPDHIAHRQLFFQQAYTQCLMHLDAKLKQYPQRKGWEKLIWTHRSRKTYKDQLNLAIEHIQTKFSREVPINILGEIRSSPCANPEAAFEALFGAVKSTYHSLKDENHFGYRGPNGSQMHAILLASQQKFAGFQKIGGFPDNPQGLHDHINALVRLHIKEYQREIKKRWFNPHGSRIEIIETLTNSLSDLSAGDEPAYFDKINLALEQSLEQITPRCCGWLRGIHRSSMFQHLNRLQDELKTLRNVAVIEVPVVAVDSKKKTVKPSPLTKKTVEEDHGPKVNWIEVEKVFSSLQAIEKLQAIEAAEEAKRQKKSKKVIPMNSTI